MSVTVAVIGHCEWVTHARGTLPGVGEIVHLSDAYDEAAGGGADTAAAVADLGVRSRFFTAVGNDATADAVGRALAAAGIEVVAVERPIPHPRAFTVIDPSGERSIMVTGGRITPTIDDPLPWNELSRCDAAYFIGDDPRTLIAARAARHLVVAARRMSALIESAVAADVIIASATDSDEAFDPGQLPVPPRAVVITEAEKGGRIVVAGREVRFDAVPLDGPLVDTYGAGDSFAAGLTVGLARGLPLDEAAHLGARAAVRALTNRGGVAFRTSR